MTYLSTFSNYDYLFPLHAIIKTKEVMDTDLNTYYYYSFRYFLSRRYIFLNLMNKKYENLITNEQKRELNNAEETYFYLNCFFYSLSFVFLKFKPIKAIKLLNYYLFLYFFFNSRQLSFYFIHEKVVKIKNTIDKPLKVKIIDILDYTRIPDFRTYIYYYNFL